jgi:hypothetical protein
VFQTETRVVADEDLAGRIFKYSSSRDFKNSLRHLRRSGGDIVLYFSQQWFLGFHNQKAFCVSDMSLL